MRAVIAFLLAGIAPAQWIPFDLMARSVAERLQSTRATTVAWAAHTAACLGLPGHTRPLLASLQAWKDRPGAEADIVRLHLLDALVQLDAKVPDTLLLPHVRDITEVPAFILLAREPQQNERDLLALFSAPPVHADHDMIWMAAGDLLCAQKAPGFAAALLQQSEFTLMVDVYVRRFNICLGHRFRGPGEHRRRLQDMPPVPVYNLGRYSFLTHRITESVGWCRETSTDGYDYCSSEHDFGSVMCHMWLEQLGGGEFAQVTQYCELEFTTEAAYIAAVQSARREFLARQHKLVEALVAGKVLTEDEASRSSLSMKVLVVDYRSGSAPALPVAPDVPAPWNWGK
jgi:hypothetical protein